MLITLLLRSSFALKLSTNTLGILIEMKHSVCAYVLRYFSTAPSDVLNLDMSTRDDDSEII